MRPAAGTRRDWRPAPSAGPPGELAPVGGARSAAAVFSRTGSEAPARTRESTKIPCVRGASLASQCASLALPPATADHCPAGTCGYELCEWFLPHLCGLRVERIEAAGAGVVIEARPAAGQPKCDGW